MSWESSIEYERILNEETRRRLGGLHSAELLIRSYDFDRIERLQAAGAWEAAGQLLAEDAVMLERAGAELVLLCTNTMHKVAPAIKSALEIPFLHLADATAEAILTSTNSLGKPIETVALLGTRYTMEQDFYRDRLTGKGLRVLTPPEAGRQVIHSVIFDELVKGIINPNSKALYLEVIDDLVASGAQAVIAGCTEIELLVTASDVSVPYFATTRLHALAAVKWSLT